MTKPTTTEVEVTQECPVCGATGEDLCVSSDSMHTPLPVPHDARHRSRTSPEAGEHPLARMVRLDEEMGLYDTDEKVPPADPLDCAAARRARFRKHIDDRLGPSTANAPDVRNPADLITLLHSENEALKHDLERQMAIANEATNRVARLEEAGDRMATFGEHDEFCNVNAYHSSNPGACSCGYGPALTDWRAVREGG